jgi:hypothetical protein
MDALASWLSGGAKDLNVDGNAEDLYSSDSDDDVKIPITAVIAPTLPQANAFAAFDIDELRTKKRKVGGEINALKVKKARVTKSLAIARTFNLEKWAFLLDFQYKYRKTISIAEFQAVATRVIQRMEHYKTSKELKAKQKIRQQLLVAIEEQREAVCNEIDGVQDDALNHDTQSQT